MQQSRKTLCLTIIGLLIIFTISSCRVSKVCGLFYPRHEIIFLDDSNFQYMKWVLPFDSNSYSVGLYSEGRYRKINKNEYLLSSRYFNPDSIKCNISSHFDSNCQGYRLKISSDIYNSDFNLNKCKLIVDIDNKTLIFSENVDTILQLSTIKRISIKLDISSNQNTPTKLYDQFKAIPINIIDSNNNYIEIHFPIETKYFNWFPIKDVLITHLTKDKFKIGNESWPVTLIRNK